MQNFATQAAVLLNDLQNYGEAAEYGMRVLSIKPNDVSVGLFVGELQLRNGRPMKAKQIFQNLEKCSPGREELVQVKTCLNHCLYSLALLHQESGAPGGEFPTFPLFTITFIISCVVEASRLAQVCVVQRGRRGLRGEGRGGKTLPVSIKWKTCGRLLGYRYKINFMIIRCILQLYNSFHDDTMYSIAIQFLTQ